ncbi:hypothetical protein Axi01nite_36020 [Actinoplanes xinjiangensis]|nr:hypothetical protein Axi01nite_36020 [Actinoplanes xinjiangensis]
MEWREDPGGYQLWFRLRVVKWKEMTFMREFLPAEIDASCNAVHLSEFDERVIDDYVSWRTAPIFPRRGRMAWHILERPTGCSSGQVYEAAKIKGVGVFDPEDETRGRDPITSGTFSSATPPTTQPLTSFMTYPHLGFRPDGRFAVVHGAAAPVGGITLSKARREFDAAHALLNAGVPAIAPLRVYRYPDLVFRGESMGVAVSAAPDRLPWRLSEAQQGVALHPGKNSSRDLYYHRLLEAFGIIGDPSAEDTRVRLICALARQVGERIRQYSMAGLFRYSAEFSNFEFDFRHRRVVLTDLDSAEFIETASIETRRLEVMRDFASGMYHLAAKFAAPTALGRFSVPMLLKHDPLAHYASGYFGVAEPNRWQTLTFRLWNAFLPHFNLINTVGAVRGDKWGQAERRSYKMDHHLFFILVFCEFAESFTRYGDSLPGYAPDPDRLILNAESFLGFRFGYLSHLRSIRVAL